MAQESANAENAVEELVEAPSETVQQGPSGMQDLSRPDNNRVLLIGQLGNIMHQIKQLLKRHDAVVSIAKNTEEAIAEFQRQDYGMVIIDVMLTNEQDGMIVLNEIRNLASVCQIQTNIIMLMSSTKDKALCEKMQAKGVALLLEKSEGWQGNLEKFYASL